MAHTATFAANGVDQEVFAPADANITSITVAGSAAAYTSLLPSRKRLNVKPTAGQQIVVTYDPVLQVPPPFMS